MRLRVLVSLLVAAVGLAVVPAAAPRSASTQKTLVTVTMKEFKFILSKRSVAHGAVVFKLVNAGKLPHDFRISGKTSAIVKPGKSATLVVTLTKGTKPYKCTVPGHTAAGMKGTLQVS